MRAVKSVAVAVSPRYVLRLDDLPKVIEADGRVWPVYLPLQQCGRLFGVDSSTVQRWAIKHDFPLVKIGRSIYADVGHIADWVDARTVTLEEITRDRLRIRAERYHLCEKCTEEYMARRHLNRSCQCECHARGEVETAVPFAQTPKGQRLAAELGDADD